MTRGRRAALAALAAAVVVSIDAPAGAHDRTTSYSSWDVSQRRARVVLRMSRLDLESELPLPRDGAAFLAAVSRHAAERLTMRAGDAACVVARAPRPLDAPAGRLTLEWEIACPAEGVLAIRSDLLLDTRSTHLHFASLRTPNGNVDHVLSNDERTWALAAFVDAARPAGAATSVAGYWLLGVEHIATGYDHLVFLFALLLAGGSFGSFGTLVKVVSGFTVGHSVTLALASLGVVRPEQAPIEASIGLSIALVAVENVWLLGPRDHRLPAIVTLSLLALAVAAARGAGAVSWLGFSGLALFSLCYFTLLRSHPRAETARWAVALLFGLVHGFGFASVLLEAELPRERLPAVLLSFNLGVEAGQLALVAIVWPLLAGALARWRQAVVEIGSAVALMFGVYWLVCRNF